MDGYNFEIIFQSISSCKMTYGLRDLEGPYRLPFLKANSKISRYYSCKNLFVIVTESVDFGVKLSLDVTLFTSSVILGKLIGLSSLGFFISNIREWSSNQLELFQVQESFHFILNRELRNCLLSFFKKPGSRWAEPAAQEWL